MSCLSILCRPPGRRTLGIIASTAAGVSVASGVPSHAGWLPNPEPKFWSEVREQMDTENSAISSDWTFMEAMQSPKIDAAEYLRDPRRRDQTVTFQALLLMRKGEGNPWGMRQLSMRAQCEDGVLEKQDSNGDWSRYPGRKGTASKVNWICAQAPNP